MFTCRSQSKEVEKGVQVSSASSLHSILRHDTVIALRQASQSSSKSRLESAGVEHDSSCQAPLNDVSPSVTSFHVKSIHSSLAATICLLFKTFLSRHCCEGLQRRTKRGTRLWFQALPLRLLSLLFLLVCMRCIFWLEFEFEQSSSVLVSRDSVELRRETGWVW